MFVREINPERRTITVSIPLTRGTEKARIKKRGVFNEYGIPVATRTESFSRQCYVEWQIGYDVVATNSEKVALTTLAGERFSGYNGKLKALYELSEYVYYFRRWEVISSADLNRIRDFAVNLNEKQLLDVNGDYLIQRSHPMPQRLFGFKFEYTQVRYPLLVHRFNSFEIIVEIKVTEKQYAIGVQPMLYICFPVAHLRADPPLLGRVARVKEAADFEINGSNIGVFLETLKMFSILSQNHNRDIISIINTVLGR